MEHALPNKRVGVKASASVYCHINPSSATLNFSMTYQGHEEHAIFHLFSHRPAEVQIIMDDMSKFVRETLTKFKLIDADMLPDCEMNIIDQFHWNIRDAVTNISSGKKTNFSKIKLYIRRTPK